MEQKAPEVEVVELSLDELDLVGGGQGMTVL
jgi:hypothetical protein